VSHGQHVGQAVGFSEMLLDQLDLFHANPLPPLNWRSLLCRHRKSLDAFRRLQWTYSAEPGVEEVCCPA
jgi:hypothetical protein